MVILIDANILLNYFFHRDPGYKYAEFILQKCADNAVSGYIAFHSVSIIWYMLRKLPDVERRNIMKQLLTIVKVTCTNHNEVQQALDRVEFKDFEDCLQDMCALEVAADFLVTDNVKDFSNATTKVISSEAFYSQFA